MYIREHKITLTLSSLGAGTGYTTGLLNGLLYAIRTRAGFAGTTAIASSLKLFREQSSGSTELALFKLLGPSSVWHEYNPRNNVMNTSGGSSGLSGLWPVDSRVYATFASSSGLSGKTLEIVCSVI